MLDVVMIARAVHVLSIVHWIGGVAVVTTIVLPIGARLNAREALAAFESFERRFAAQARFSILIAGLSGLYMLWAMYGAASLQSVFALWWIDLMIGVWTLFALAVYIFEPLFLHRLFAEFALRSPQKAFRIATGLHAFALLLSAAAIAAGVFGAHGAL
jgi:uncharacterized membrane protein